MSCSGEGRRNENHETAAGRLLQRAGNVSTEMSIQPLDVLGGVMFLAGLAVVTGVVASAVAAGQRLGVGALLMVLGTAAVAGPRMYQKALEATN